MIHVPDISMYILGKLDDGITERSIEAKETRRTMQMSKGGSGMICGICIQKLASARGAEQRDT